jgi:hypothetical protein
VGPGEEKPAVVFPEALTFGPELPVIPLGPEPVKVCGPGLTLEAVEFPEITSRQDLQVRSVFGNRLRVIEGSALIVGGVPVGPAQG